MPTPVTRSFLPPDASLEELLQRLKRAVEEQDAELAVELELQIQRRLIADGEISPEREAIEQEAKALVRRLRPRPVRFTDGGNEVKALGEAGGAIYPVWFGTNRKPTAEGAGFTHERGGALTRGRVDVLVPQAHRFGETGSSFWKRLLRFDLRDDHLRVQALEQLAADRLAAQLGQAVAMARDGGEEPQALFFLHGYNTDFEEAAIRAAQLGFDLSVPGPVAFFSWPSRGAVLHYLADEETIKASEGAITEFLLEFATQCQAAGATKVHVIAHSMGNRGLLAAMQRIQARATAEQPAVRFGQIILAAPDVDRDVFLELAALYPHYADRATLYASRRDLAVYLSSLLHAAPRAGYFTPYTVAAGVDTVAVPNFNIDLLGHTYFAQADALLSDIHTLLNHNTPPESRQRLHRRLAEGKAFWELRR